MKAIKPRSSGDWTTVKGPCDCCFLTEVYYVQGIRLCRGR